ncbi:unnamed protein product [Amoebophrya sp. A120]|nr:unnamed protein product [Amoebophrya sp. A120]|eukprot:GSA120T00019141001.1
MVDDIWVVGDAFVDVQAFGVERLPYRWDVDVECSSTALLPGGSAGNTARQLHCLFLPDDKKTSKNSKTKSAPPILAPIAEDSKDDAAPDAAAPVSPSPSSGSESPASAGSSGKPKPNAVFGSVRFLSAVGDDTLGRWYRDQLAKEGLDVSGLVLLPAVTTSTCIILSGNRDRSMVSCYSSTDFEWKSSSLYKKMRFWLEGVPDSPKQSVSLEGSCTAARYVPKHVHIGGFFNLRGLQISEDFLKALASLGKRTTISVAPQYDSSGKWTGLNEAMIKLLCFIDILFVNQNEYNEFAKKGFFKSSFCRHGMLIVKTRGAMGCEIAVINREPGYEVEVQTLVSVPVLPPVQGDEKKTLVKVVDTTGAGDAFAAGFLYYWLRNRSGFDDFLHFLELCAKSGNEVALKSVQKRGACEHPVAKTELPEWIFY